MRTNKILSYNLIFLELLSIYLLYISFVVYLIYFFIKSCFFTLVSTYTNSINWATFLLSKDFQLNFILLLILSFLISKIVFGWIKFFERNINTSKFISSLIIKKTFNINYILNKDNLLFTSGILFPQIFISKNITDRLSDKELQIVSSHETFHKNNLDPLKKIIVLLINDSTPWFPYKNSLLNAYSISNELAADGFATDDFNNIKELLKSLSKILETKQDVYINHFLDLKNKDRVDFLIENKGFNTLIINSSLIILYVFVLLIWGIMSASTVYACNDLNKCYDDIIKSNKSQCYIQNYSKIETKFINDFPNSFPNNQSPIINN